MITITEITRSEFCRLLKGEAIVRVTSNGCCNVMQFYLEDGSMLEIESVTEEGVPSMEFSVHRNVKGQQMSTTRQAQPPAVIQRWINDEHETPESMRDYILRGLIAFATIQHPATDETGWVAFKLGCGLAQAKSAIKWAKGESK